MGHNDHDKKSFKRVVVGVYAMKGQQPTLGAVLRDLRARFGWTLKEMSAKCGIPVSTLSKVEHDRLTLTYDKLQQLSQRLNIRSAERRVGKECDSKCRSRWGP